jgi:hypothetical protein
MKRIKFGQYICYNIDQQNILPTHFATKTGLYKWMEDSNKWVKIRGKGRRMHKHCVKIPNWAIVNTPTFFSRSPLVENSNNYKTAVIKTIKI